MKLYYKAGSCSLAVRILINELQLPCQYIEVDLTNKKIDGVTDYLVINPKGSVPALLLESGILLTENAVIQQYLADMHKAHQLLPPIYDIKRYQVLEWLNFVATDLHKSCAPFFMPSITDQLKRDIFTPLLAKRLDFLNHHLDKNEYLFHNEFTIADSYCFVVLSWLKRINLNIENWSHVAKYFHHIAKRPAVSQSLSEENISL